MHATPALNGSVQPIAPKSRPKPAFVARAEDDALIKAERALKEGENWDALQAVDECLKLNPTRPEALFLAGTALMRGGCHGAALVLLNAAVQMDERAATWNSIGVCLNERLPVEAYAAFKKANALQADNPNILSNLASTADALGRPEESLAWAEKALALDPTHKDALNNSALALLTLGRWAEAWPRYAMGMPGKNRQERFFSSERQTPRWRGEPGKTVVIYGEQGIGDEILYASMIEQALASGSRIILETDQRLEGLWRRSFPDATVYGTRWQVYCDWPHDERPNAKIEIGGLGELYAPEPFRRGAYLVADPLKRAMARAWLDGVVPRGNLRVGIAWTSGGWFSGRRDRSLDPGQLGPLLSTDGASFICLEYDEPQLPDGVLDLRSWVKKGADYDDAAALVAELDLVIAPMTSVVDLAGALGVPTWALVTTAPPWRYSAKAGEDAMWFYESVRTYRQSKPYLWSAPVARAARDLRAMAGQRRAAA